MIFARNVIKKIVINNSILNIDGCELPLVDTAINLGVEILSSFHFHDHISEKIKKSFLKFKIKEILCSSQVLSIFNCLDEAYTSCIDQFDSRKVQLMQNCCVRFVCGIRRGNSVLHNIKGKG